MAKKMSPKEKLAMRKAQEEAKKEQFRKKQKAQEETAAEQHENPQETSPAENRTENKKITKSKAKAAGVKSAFLSGGEVILTSFGAGNDAVVEKVIRNDGTVENKTEKPVFSVHPVDKQIAIKGRIEALADHPAYYFSNKEKSPESYPAKRRGDDMIHARDALEKRYFGKNFDDNIHIQLIYNILDIEKILSLHINNIVYAIDNLMRVPDAEFGDFIGYLSTQNSYEVFCHPERYAGTGEDGQKKDHIKENISKSLDQFNKLLKNPRLGYFGSAFYQTGFDKKVKIASTKLKDEKDIYYTLCLLGMTRQALSHSYNSTRDALYDAEQWSSDGKVKAALKDLLDRTYADRVDALNRDFIQHSKKNLTIIFQAFGIETLEKKTQTVKDYYDYSVKKTQKNLGFSLKKLREIFLDYPDAEILRNKKYDSVRAKLYGLLDFVIYEHYRADEKRIEANVSTLRAALSEEEKDCFYQKEAKRLWNAIKPVLTEHILPFMDGNKIKSLSEDKEISRNMLDDCRIGTDTEYFTKLIYLFTLFIDGKEINDLLTTLINKFENIAGFLSVLRDTGLDCDFMPQYGLFARSKNVAEELRAVNSFARMTAVDASAKRIMFVEAAQMLGDDRSEKDLEAYFEKMLGKDGSNYGKKDTNLRNFIAGNVIESSRFKYLIRYNNAKKTRALASNRQIVSFVLTDIPDKQIDRYYSSCICGGAVSAEAKREALADKITGLSFGEFEYVKQKPSNRDEAEDKERKKAAVGLYLTVLYILTKNLVNINSRYFLAFHCLERDTQLLGSAAGHNKTPFVELTQDFIDKKYINKHSREYLSVNIDNSDDHAIRVFRNTVMHLSAIRNADRYIDDIRGFRSYFEIYHYLVQRAIINSYGFKFDGKMTGKTEQYFAAINKYNTYCMDFTKALNTPFGYNLARYKNLSIEGLFDKNRPGEADCGKH